MHIRLVVCYILLRCHLILLLRSIKYVSFRYKKHTTHTPRAKHQKGGKFIKHSNRVYEIYFKLTYWYTKYNILTVNYTSKI